MHGNINTGTMNGGSQIPSRQQQWNGYPRLPTDINGYPYGPAHGPPYGPPYDPPYGPYSQMPQRNYNNYG